MTEPSPTRTSRAAAPAARRATGRTHDPEGVRANILEVATREFAEKGFSGARVDEIAAKTDTSKRMIYYYFTDKEGLFVAVLERAYAGIRSIELNLNLEGLCPVEALRRLAAFTFDYQNTNPYFVRLVMIENIHNGVHIGRSERLRQLNLSVLRVLEDVYRRGVQTGVFRAGVDVVDLHMTISALSFFNVSNRQTFSKIFKHDMASRAALARRREVVAETVLRFALADLRTADEPAPRRRQHA
ncbi:MAG: TetR family transcriptional regulator [Rhodospirillales bacterium]|nr:TetR family transcriptional regulator [Rhodospirillales bacterium]MDE2575828.1 TetR family transcriptional regulator [Rhodospirillales bacterium]